MAFASGVFSRLYNFTADAAASIPAQPGRFDAELNGIATGLSTCLLRDGSQTVIANIPMNGYKFTGLGAGSASGQAVIFDQLANYAPLASPAFTGTPTAPTAMVGTNTTQIATTAFVTAAVSGAGYAPLASPAFTGTPSGPTATVGTNTTQLATCAFVLANTGGFTTTYTSPARVLGTNYTAGSTYRLVIANFGAAPTAGSTIFTPTVGGVTLPTASVTYASGLSSTGPMTFVVPPGATYSVAASGNNVAGASIISWVEL